MASALELNACDLEQELAWFGQVLDVRFKLYFGQESSFADVFAVTPPDLSASASPYAHFVRHYELNFAERLAVVLALTPHIRPRLLDVFFTKNQTFDRRFTEFGGVHGGPDGDFTPTGETLGAHLSVGGDTRKQGIEPLIHPAEPQVQQMREALLTPAHAHPLDPLLDQPFAGALHHPAPRG
jgi:hypothetical protein